MTPLMMHHSQGRDVFTSFVILHRSHQGYPVDPLLHSCIVCASVSCPDVALTAYKPESLQDDMEAGMRRFLANDNKGFKLDKAERLVTLSKVSCPPSRP